MLVHVHFEPGFSQNITAHQKLGRCKEKPKMDIIAHFFHRRPSDTLFAVSPLSLFLVLSVKFTFILLQFQWQRMDISTIYPLLHYTSHQMVNLKCILSSQPVTAGTILVIETINILRSNSHQFVIPFMFLFLLKTIVYFFIITNVS